MEPRLAEEFEAFKRRTRKENFVPASPLPQWAPVLLAGEDATIRSFLSAPRLDPTAPDVFDFSPLHAELQSDTEYERTFPDIGASRILPPGTKFDRPVPLTKAHRAHLINGKGLPSGPKLPAGYSVAEQNETWMSKGEMEETLRLQLLQMERANANLTRPQNLDLRDMPTASQDPIEEARLSVCLCGLARFSKFNDREYNCAACCEQDGLAVCARIEAGLSILACLSSRDESPLQSDLDKLVHLVTGLPAQPPLTYTSTDIEQVRDNFLRLARFDKGLRLISGTWLASLSVASEVPYFMLTSLLRSFPYIATVGLTVDSGSISCAFNGPLCVYLRTRNRRCLRGPNSLASLFHEAAASMLSSGEVEASSPGHRQLTRHFLLAVVSLALWMEETAEPERRVAAASCVARSVLAGYLECLQASVRAGGSVFFSGNELRSEAGLRARLLVPAGEAEMALVSVPLACLFIMIISFVPLGMHNLSQEAAHAVANQVVKRGAEIVLRFEEQQRSGHSVSTLVENLEPSVAIYMLMAIVTKSVLWQAMKHPLMHKGERPGLSSEESLTPVAALLFTIIAHGGEDRVAAAVIQMAMQSNHCDAAPFLHKLQLLYPIDPAA